MSDYCDHTELLAGSKFVCMQPAGDAHPVNSWDGRLQHYMVRQEYGNRARNQEDS